MGAPAPEGTDPLADSVEVEGLSAILDEDTELPYVDLALRAGARRFRAAVLATGDGWTVNVRDERDRSVPGSGAVYEAQSDAVLAAMLIALETARQSAAPLPYRITTDA